MATDLTPIRSALIAIFTDFMPDERTGGSTTDGAHWTAKNGVTGYTTDHGAHPSANLGT